MTFPLTPFARWTCASFHTRRAVVRRLTHAALFLALTGVFIPATATAQPSPRAFRPGRYKLDDELSRRAAGANGWRRSRVIVQLDAGQTLPASLKNYQKGPRLDLINGYVLDVPDSALEDVTAQAVVKSAHFDRPIWAADYYSTAATGAAVVQQSLGLTGEGIGVAVIDSGIASWHDDLTAANRRPRLYPYGNQRVTTFVDFVSGQTLPYDDHGHGSHVAGIILGNGYDSSGKQAGMAPDASLVALKVLDQNGKGTISHIIAALDWVVLNARTHNIRVVNLSAGAGVTESYWTDPLTLAAKRVVDQGIVVVAAAGNLGKNADGEKQWGGILCPGNAPWVITVGASSTQGTLVRDDDVLAAFSSLGPTRGDYLAKPDLLAPGYGIVSLAAPASTLYQSYPQYLLPGTVPLGSLPYLSLSGTSMAAPQVSGVVALMLQANPSLTPNFVKAILQYTAENHDEYRALEEGAGFLDALGAVKLAQFYASNHGGRMPVEDTWSRQIIWGNHLVSGGNLNPMANAWTVGLVWGAEALRSGDNVVWGTRGGDNVVWGTRGGDNVVWGTRGGDNVVWGTRGGDNVVWGTRGGDNVVWGTRGDDNVVWGTRGGDNVVWGTRGGDNVVWGTRGGDNVVWGTRGDDNVVWGTRGDDNVVWGTACGGDNCGGVIWGTRGDDNVVWGTRGGDNVVWGTRGDDNVVWGTDAEGNTVWSTRGEDNVVWGTRGGDNVVWGTAAGDNVVWPDGEDDAQSAARGRRAR